MRDDTCYTDPVPERRAWFSPDGHGERLLNFLEKQVLAAVALLAIDAEVAIVEDESRRLQV